MNVTKFAQVKTFKSPASGKLTFDERSAVNRAVGNCRVLRNISSTRDHASPSSNGGFNNLWKRLTSLRADDLIRQVLCQGCHLPLPKPFSLQPQIFLRPKISNPGPGAPREMALDTSVIGCTSESQWMGALPRPKSMSERGLEYPLEEVDLPARG